MLFRFQVVKFQLRFNFIIFLYSDSDEPDQWSVLRRYPEFYVLESKLTEFHENLGIVALPSKKLFAKNFEFLDSKRPDFEKFLQVNLCILLHCIINQCTIASEI